MGLPVEFREYSPNDYAEADALHHHVLQHAGRDESLIIPENAFFLLAVQDNIIVGMGGYASHGADAELRSMRIRPDLQSQGIGTSLLRLLEDRILAQGHRRIFLDTIDAKSFYLRHSYTVIGEYPYEGRRCTEMEKFLH
jgi:N-acetylglutamate synthase-like GNAT family acetyltransferase